MEPNPTTTPADSGWFGNILSNVKDIGQVATGVIGAVKGAKTPVPKPVSTVGGMSTQTILIIAAGGLTVLLVVMMFLRRK